MNFSIFVFIVLMCGIFQSFLSLVMFSKDDLSLLLLNFILGSFPSHHVKTKTKLSGRNRCLSFSSQSSGKKLRIILGQSGISPPCYQESFTSELLCCQHTFFLFLELISCLNNFFIHKYHLFYEISVPVKCKLNHSII